MCFRDGAQVSAVELNQSFPIDASVDAEFLDELASELVDDYPPLRLESLVVVLRPVTERFDDVSIKISTLAD
jgi:hypothetical protein